MNRDDEKIICPFCGEGVLELHTCRSCARTFLMCEECESVYTDKKDALERTASKCPYCGAQAY